jgi:hypothetical protein
MGRAGLLCVAAVTLSLSQAACLVQITHVSDPGPIFEAARAEAERVAGRKGRAHEVNVLVWDPGDRQIVRVSVPMWIARRAARHIDQDRDDADARGDHGRDSMENALRRVRLEDIEKAGLGVLVEVAEPDGEQVLVWLR